MPWQESRCSKDLVLETHRGSWWPAPHPASSPSSRSLTLFLCLLPAISHLCSAPSHLAHQGLAAQVEQPLTVLRFTLCIPTNLLPATPVAPLQLPAPLISMVTEDTTIIQILPQRAGLHSQVFLGWLVLSQLTDIPGEKSCPQQDGRRQPPDVGTWQVGAECLHKNAM